ncbi:MAG: DUF4397 domain-containing protein [Rubrivivax sp.]|nr:DUF4397 domain-containing protein [Rubrivivax sp.]
MHRSPPRFCSIRSPARWPGPLLLAAVVALGMLLAGCGDAGVDRSKAQLRVVNASGYAELDLRVDDGLRQGRIAYGEAAGYLQLDPGTPTLQLARAGSATPLLSIAAALARNRYTTLLAWGREGALQAALLDENVAQPDSGRALLRVFNAAPEAGALDVYLTAPGDDLATAVPLQAGAAAGVLGNALAVDSRGWRLRVTAAGSKSDLRLDLPALTLASREVATLVLTPSRGGALVHALLLSQQAGVARLDGTAARVRVVAGLADGATVGATVGGVALMNAVGSPAVGLYALVPAGTQPVALAVDGTPLAAADVVLAAGGDFTLLVRGRPAAAAASWLEDDNRPALDAAQARVRLVHGVADLAAPLALTVDFVPAADGVLPGDGSGYASFAATTTARLAVTASGQPAPLFTAIDQRLDGGGVYSVFVVGPLAAPTGILRRDR